MDFDDVLEELGELGRFQIKVYTLVCLPVLFAAANSLSYVFTAGSPYYRCYVHECDDKIRPKYNQEWLSWALPEGSSSSSNHFVPEQCERYKINRTVLSFINSCSPLLFTSETQRCDSWVFDDERTIVNDFLITCLENQWKLSLVGTSHFAGIVVGSAVFGVMADRYGRKIIFVFCIILMSISGILQVVSPDYVTFVVLIFINALGTSGVYPLAFILGVELVGKKKREVTGMVLNYFYAVGEAIIALIAWLARDWVTLQLVISAPPLLFVSYYWLVPESVRWLLAKEKNELAKGIVCKAAEVNKVVLSEGLLSGVKDEELAGPSTEDTPKEEANILPVIKLMAKSNKLVIRFCIIYFIWGINAFVYYGLSLNSTSMSGNKYLNFALTCLIEIPGYSLAWICIHKIGRRISLVGSLLSCAVTCGAVPFVTPGMVWLETLLSLIGKLAITSSFGVVYVYTAEMLPTIVRSGGVGAASTFARVGALVAPFVPLLGVYVEWLPMTLFAGVAFLAGCLALKLPETIGRKLPETVDDALFL